MKTIKTLLAFVICLPAFAQIGVTVTPTTFTGFTQDEVPAFEVVAPNVSRTSFMNHWERYLKGKSDEKTERSERDIVLKNAQVKKLGDGLFNIYLNFEDQLQGTKLIVGIEKVGVGFLDASNPDYGVALQKLIAEECNKVYLEDIKDNLAQEEKVLKGMEKDLKKKQVEENKFSKKIYSKNTSISRMNTQIASDKDVVVKITGDITRHRGMLTTASYSTDDRKTAEKEMRSLENKMKSLQRDIDKQSKKVIDTQTEIGKLEYEKGKVTQDISILLERVAAQRAVVLEL